MLKIQKVSALALMLSAVISGNVLAAEQNDAKFKGESSYAVGVLFGTDLQGLINAQKWWPGLPMY